MRAYERLNQRLVAAWPRRRRSCSFGRHDQLPATAALEPHRDADGEGVDLETRAHGHYSAASSKGFGSGRSGRLLVRQLRDKTANPRSMQRDGDAVGRHLDPLDQQPQDARLLGRVELIPDRIESAERLDHFALVDQWVLGRTVLPARCGDGPRDELGRREQPTHLPEDQSLHLAGSNRAHRAGVIALRLAPTQM